MPRFAALVLLTGLLVAGVAAPQADDKGPASPPPAGTWKFFLPLQEEVGSRPLWLIKLEKKDGGWEGKLLASALRDGKGTVEKVSVSADRLRFTLRTTELTLPCEVRLTKEAKGKLYGLTSRGARVTPIELERTTLTSLDPFEQAKEMIAKQPAGVEAVQMAIRLLSQAEAKKVKPEEVRAWAEKAIRSAEMYGPAWQRDILLTVAEVLSDEKGFEAVALTYARRAERSLEPKEPAGVQKRVLGVLANVLEKAGKKDDLKEVRARLDKLDFTIKMRRYAGRKTKSDRVALVELFSNGQDPQCAAADLAFAALAKTYSPTEAVLLRYALHAPEPDPLAGPASEGRLGFYEGTVRQVPAVLFNGKLAGPARGDKDDAPERYGEFVSAIEPLLETPAKAKLKLSATRKGDKVSITALVSDLQETGDDIRLRIALVEPEVAYKGKSGVAGQVNLVRALPAGEEGVVLNAKMDKKTFTVDLADLKKKIEAYLKKYADKRPFPDKDRPIDLKTLRVVAFIQNDQTAEVFQAAQADVKGE